MSKKSKTSPKKTSGPILFEDEIEINVEEAPPIDAEASAMGVLTSRMGRRTGLLGRVFLFAFSALFGLVASITFWEFANSLLLRYPLLGRAVFALIILLLIVVVIYLARELWAMRRMRRLEHLRQAMNDAKISGSLVEAQKQCARLGENYRRSALIDYPKWRSGLDEIPDNPALLEYTERQLLGPLDEEARREIEKRARQVAMITAFVPLALADLITVLVANIGMIRRIAEIYAGRPGLFGGWRLFRKIALHLVATGAIAVGDDVIGSVMGGNLLGKISRRFGEGVINAALSARVGVAAMEVCRPMEFGALARPSISELIPSALAGFLKRGS